MKKPSLAIAHSVCRALLVAAITATSMGCTDQSPSQPGTLTPDSALSGEKAAQADNQQMGILTYPIPMRAEGRQFIPLPLMASLKTDILHPESQNPESDDVKQFNPVSVVRSLLKALADDDGGKISKLAPEATNGKNVGKTLKLMLGESDSPVIERCFYVGKRAYISVRGDSSRPSNALIPVNMDSELVEFGVNFSVIGSEEGQFLGALEFAIRAAPDEFRPVRPKNSLFIAQLFADDGGAPITVQLATAQDSSAQDLKIKAATDAHEAIWKKLEQIDYGGFQESLAGQARDYYKRNCVEGTENFSAFVKANSGSRRILRAGALNDTVVLCIRREQVVGGGTTTSHEIDVLQNTNGNKWMLSNFSQTTLPLQFQMVQGLSSFK